MKPYTFWSILRLLRDPDQWERRPPLGTVMSDDLITKDKRIRVHATTPVRFREGEGYDTLYEPNFLVYPVVEFFGRRLLKKVAAR